MPALRIHVPKYCLHKARGLAYVRDHGKVRYLGRWNAAESKEAYGRCLIEWEARQREAHLRLQVNCDAARAGVVIERREDATVVGLCAAYLDHAESYYRKHGQLTRSVDEIKR
jgi:hypothetical protein